MDKNMKKSLVLYCLCLFFLAGKIEHRENRVVKGFEDRIGILSYYGDAIIEGTVQAKYVDSLYYPTEYKKL